MNSPLSTSGTGQGDGTGHPPEATAMGAAMSPTAGGRRPYAKPGLRRLGVLQSCAGSQNLAGDNYNPFFTPGGTYSTTPSGP
ncbi:MAG: hypothetical protein ACKO3N_11555 [Verrucomicrobiota bacterium]